MRIELNTQQQEAVEHTDGPLLILAGAGSGKTRVLVSRAAYLIENGLAKPYQILALTFTNKAAGEIKNRAVEMIGRDGAHLAAGTFHSIFARLMRQEGRNIDLDPNFSIIDTDDKKRLIKSILRDRGISSERAKSTAIAGIISRAKNEMVGPEAYALRTPFDTTEQIAAEIYKTYEKRLRMMNGLDFDDLLLRPLEAFNKYPHFLERLQERFIYVMVDEYQDTNRAQYLLVRQIARKHTNICVVGDDDQAIYGWRGATVRNILDFKKDWDTTRIIRLEQNYRSTRPILDAAWAVIKHNPERHPKKLWTNREEGEKIDVLGGYDDEEEALKFITVIEEVHRLENTPYNHFAILYRTNAQSLPFERSLRGSKIPYHVVGGLRFYERKEVKDILAYLRCIINPADDISLLRIINYPPRSISQPVLVELQAIARAQDMPIYKAVSQVIADKSISSRRVKSLESLVGLFQELRKIFESEPIHIFAQEVVDKIQLIKRLNAEEKDDLSRAESKVANIQNLLGEISRFAEDSPDATLTDFLEEVTLVSDTDTLKEDIDRVNLLTLHSAKGLEFPVVFIGGMEDGILPLRARDGSDGDIQEERRLFYVGVTRAMNKLVLGYAVNRLRWGTLQWNGQSRFLREIPVDLLRNTLHIARSKSKKQYGNTLKSKLGKKKSYNDVDQNRIDDTVTADDLRKGLLVNHPKFGLGVIVNFQRMGLDSRIRVDFDNVGEKALILKFARLKVEA